VLPPYITISTQGVGEDGAAAADGELGGMQGVAPKEGEINIIVNYAPLETHCLDGCVIKMLIPSAKRGADESSYLIELQGRSRRPQVEFSVLNYDFGYCFVNKKANFSILNFAGIFFPKNLCRRFSSYDPKLQQCDPKLHYSIVIL
jgi:hypothetical protein